MTPCPSAHRSCHEGAPVTAPERHDGGTRALCKISRPARGQWWRTDGRLRWRRAGSLQHRAPGALWSAGSGASRHGRRKAVTAGAAGARSRLRKSQSNLPLAWLHCNCGKAEVACGGAPESVPLRSAPVKVSSQGIVPNRCLLDSEGQTRAQTFIHPFLRHAGKTPRGGLASADLTVWASHPY